VVRSSDSEVLLEGCAARGAWSRASGDELEAEAVRVDEVGKLATRKLDDSPSLLEREAEHRAVPVDHPVHVVHAEANVIGAQ
jgi:hypothetical protein